MLHCIMKCVCDGVYYKTQHKDQDMHLAEL